MEHKIKPNTMFSFWSHCLDSDETNFTCVENPPSSVIDKQSLDTEKVDPPSLTDTYQYLLKRGLTIMRSLTYPMKSLK